MEPYEPPTGGDLEKLPSLVKGMMSASKCMQVAVSANEWSLASLLTFLDYVRHPSGYRKLASHKSALTFLAKDERVVCDLMGIFFRFFFRKNLSMTNKRYYFYCAYIAPSGVARKQGNNQ